MADSKISALNTAELPLLNTAVIPIVPASARQTYKTPLSALGAYVASDSTVASAITSKAIAMALIFS